MKLHLVDGTYELFRSYYGAPPAEGRGGRPVGAVAGLVASMGSLLREADLTHVAVAFDHVIESFRNELYDGYKTGEGLPEDLLEQFELAEQATRALGMVTWPMVEFEADDALAAAAARWAEAPGVEEVRVLSPDKDLAQCVRGTHVVCVDRRRGKLLDEAGVVAKFGVPPRSMPDWLALVGDTADGYPGLAGFGKATAAALLARYGKLEAIPDEAARWDVSVRGAERLAATLRQGRDDARLYRRLATLRTDVPLEPAELEGLRWQGPDEAALESLSAELADPELPRRAPRPRR